MEEEIRKMPKIIEQFIKGKISEEKCEDRLVITDDFVAVIDGVSSKSSYLDDGKTTGNIAAGLIEDVIKSMPFDIDFNGFIESVNSSYKNYYEKSSFDLYGDGDSGWVLFVPYCSW